GSTNAPIHLTAIARHMGVDCGIDDWQQFGRDVPLLVNMQPSGEYLGEDYYRAGGVPAVIGQLMRRGLINEHAQTVDGRSIGDLCRDAVIEDERVIRPIERPLLDRAGFIVLTGNLFDRAIIKSSVISPAFRARYLANPDDPEAFAGPVVVFDGPEDYHRRIDDPALGITTGHILIMRGVGPIGFPGSAEVVNMRAPDYLIRAGHTELPCIGDGRQSGTSGSPSILNASPEAAAGGGLAILQTGDIVRVDLRAGRVDVQLDADTIAARRAALAASGGFAMPATQTPWQEIYRSRVGGLGTGAILEGAEAYQRVAQTVGVPRDNH
ncbi:MAG: dihydroxy-acid dehydratase, partial [Sphingomonadales bacterium]